MSSSTGDRSQIPDARRWLASRFPHRAGVIADLRRRVGRAPAPLTICPPDASLFGRAFDITVGLDLAHGVPYAALFDCLPDAPRRVLLHAAGFAPDPANASSGAAGWSRTAAVHPARLFAVANVLAPMADIFRVVKVTSIDHGRAIIRDQTSDLRATRIFLKLAFHARPAFRQFWDSYQVGFRDLIRGFGPVHAAPVLLDGYRQADCIAGTTSVELKTGHLTEDRHYDEIIDQTLTYGLLAPLSGYPITDTAVYLARYQVLARYPFEAVAAELAGGALDLADLAEELADVVRHTEHPRWI